MKIMVVPHTIAAILEPPAVGKNVMIRITSYEFQPLDFATMYAAVHQERFLDIEDDKVHLIDNKQWGDLGAISEDQAHRIVAFIRQHADADFMLVHCDAGLSRSPAVALAAADILGVEARELRDGIGRIYAPNRSVYARLAMAAGLREQRQSDLEKVFGDNPFI